MHGSNKWYFTRLHKMLCYTEMTVDNCKKTDYIPDDSINFEEVCIKNSDIL